MLKVAIGEFNISTNYMDRTHFKCRLWKALWGLSALSLILAWVAARSGSVWGYGMEHWFWDALILGVLAIPIKLDCHSCSVCMPEGRR